MSLEQVVDNSITYAKNNLESYKDLLLVGADQKMKMLMGFCR